MAKREIVARVVPERGAHEGTFWVSIIQTQGAHRALNQVLSNHELQVAHFLEEELAKQVAREINEIANK